MRLLISLGLVAAIVFGALYYFNFLNDNQPKVARKVAKEQAATVDALVVDFEDIQPTIRNFGQIIAGKQLPLSTSVSGRVSYVSPNFKTGAIVKAGETLIKIDDFEYRGNLLSAKANLQDISFRSTDIDNQVAATKIAYKSTFGLYESAQQDYQGSIKLQKSGIISKQALDDKSMALIQQKQSLDQMSANLTNLKNQKLQLLATTEVQQYAVDKAIKDLANTEILTPFDAYIHNANLELGQYVGNNTAIATLLDQQKIDVKFTLSDGQYGRIIAQDGTIIGRKIQAVWQLGQIEKRFEAQINRVNSEIIAASGGIDLYASIINLEAVEALRIGAFVKVLIPDQTYQQIIKIPDYMVYDNDLVYVVERTNPKPVITTDEAESGTNKAVEKPETDARPKKPVRGEGQRSEEQRPEGQKATQRGEGQRGERQAGQGQNNGEKPEAELKANEKRLESVQIQVVGYDGDQVLIINKPDSENPLEAGDVLLQTRLTLAGKGVLVITSEESAKKQAAALAKLKERNASGEGNGNRRFGRRGARNIFGG
ncbi:MAG: HlyD family efflux transporter periplasmic adaptor subunit [Alphaproteobacteria bacterium]|nr:HlyD family efflux transporter periplasmic adaptor subunit [Alphaproteobacteria bacterium]